MSNHLVSGALERQTTPSTCYLQQGFLPPAMGEYASAMAGGGGDSGHRLVAGRLNQVLELSSDGIAFMDRDFRVTYINPRGREISAAPADVVGRNHWEVWPHAIYDGSPYLENYYRAMNDRVGGEFEAYYPEPIRQWLHINVQPAEEGIVVFYRDISASRREAAALRENEARLRAMYSSSLEYIGLMAADGTLLEINEAALRFGGCTRAEVLGMPMWEGPWFRYTPGMPAHIRAAIYRAAEGEPLHTELALTRPNGEVMTFDFSLSPIRDDSGNVAFIVPEGCDISALKRAQDLLMQNEKLAVVGRLASSIAHEINNPLESVTNLLYLARHSESHGETQSFLDDADSELRRVSAISNQTLRFHRQSTTARATTADDLLSTVLTIHQGRIANSKVKIERGNITATPVICFDGEVRQVLGNLVGNAIDALQQEGGRLLLRAREATDWCPGANNRRGLRITVADTGGGISPQALDRIFDPFFTTKGATGTGLGLWISRQIVQRHQGILRVRSRKSGSDEISVHPHGTVFSLFLPFDAVLR